MKIFVSEDEEHVAKIRTALKENGGYCPCRLIKTPETKCPCQEFRANKPGNVPLWSLLQSSRWYLIESINKIPT